MKTRLYFALLSLVLTITLLCSCGTGESTSPDPENMIYKHGTELFVVKDDPAFPDSMISAIISAAQKATATMPKIRMSDSEKNEHEIVIGDTARQISATAMALLPEATHSKVNFLIYSDGSSLALVYHSDGENIAATQGVEYLMANCLTADSYVRAPGVVYVGEIDLDEYYAIEDEKMLAERWANLESAVGGELGKAVADAFRDLYTLYDDEAVEWFANLYAPRICVCDGKCLGTAECRDGGYYYSNSARDTAGYMPDAESTSQALNFIQSSGMGWGNSSYAKTIPEWMAEEIADFIYYLQDPDDGYFYHPQWGKGIGTTRRSRDYSWCIAILNTLGREARYSSITSTAALTSPLGSSAATAVSTVIAADGELNIPAHLVDEASFRAYLDNYSSQMATRSYSIGSELTSQSNQIIARDKTLKAQGATYSLMDILIDWLNSHQNPDTGTWDADRDYHSVNGLLKISGIYNAAKVPMPYPREAAQSAVDAIVSDEAVSAVVDIYNTWFSFGNITENLRNYGGAEGDALADEIIRSLREQAPAAIAASKAKIALFKKDSGSFSYNLQYSSATSQGAPAAVPQSVEGDVNATVISITGLTMNIYEALDLYSYRVPIYTYSDWRVYESILSGLEPVIKDTTINIGDPITFDDDDIGAEPFDVAYKGGTGSNGSLTVIDDPREGKAGNVIRLTSFAGAGDTVTVNNTVSALNAKVFVFESDFCLESSSNGYVAQITIGNSAYMYTFRVSGGKVELWDSSSANGQVALENKFPVSAEIGEWFHVKAEYYYGDHDTVRIKMYWNGKLVGITDNYYDSAGKKLTAVGTPSSSYATTRVYIMSSVNASLLMDNMHAYKVAESYVPENIDIPDAPNVDQKTDLPPVSSKVDFEDLTDDTLPSVLTATLRSDGAAARVAELTKDGERTKALCLTTSAGANDSFVLQKTVEKKGYKSVAFEADLMFDMTSSGVIYQFMFESTSSSRAYMLNISKGSSGIEIADCSSTSGTSADRHTNVITTSAAKNGEWFNLRVEYYTGGRDSLRIHIYINDKLTFVSDNYYGFYQTSDPEPTNMIERVRIYSLNSAAGDLYIDNYSLVQSSDTNPSPELTLGAK